MPKPSKEAEQGPAGGMLRVKIITVDGMEYGVDMNHFYDYHCECQAESLTFPSSGVFCLQCSLQTLSNSAGGSLQIQHLEFKKLDPLPLSIKLFASLIPLG